MRDVAARNIGKLTHHTEHLARTRGRQLLHLRAFLRVQESKESPHIGARLLGGAVGHSRLSLIDIFATLFGIGGLNSIPKRNSPTLHPFQRPLFSQLRLEAQSSADSRVGK